MRAGCHVSIRRGYLEAAKLAHGMGADAFQYFPKNPRRLSVKEFNRLDASECLDYCRKHGLASVAHAPYPTNLSVSDGALSRSTAASLRNDLEIADACGSLGVVVHFGKSKERDPLQGYRNIIQCLNEALAGWNGNARLLIENQAGEGTSMGITLEELTSIRGLADRPECIGFCFDTCHAFASGLWNGSNTRQMVERGLELDYFRELRAVHCNDSLYGTGSKRDRHARIGQGEIGADLLADLLRELPMADAPIILETGPGPDGTHRDEIRWIRQL